MEAGSMEAHKGQWQCIVCSQSFINVLRLPCNHSFCEGCLHTWLEIYTEKYQGTRGEFPCQLCWTLFQIPATGIMEFQQNYHVFELQKMLGGLNMAQEMQSPAPEELLPLNDVPQINQVIPDQNMTAVMSEKIADSQNNTTFDHCTDSMDTCVQGVHSNSGNNTGNRFLERPDRDSLSAMWPSDPYMESPHRIVCHRMFDKHYRQQWDLTLKLHGHMF